MRTHYIKPGETESLRDFSTFATHLLDSPGAGLVSIVHVHEQRGEFLGASDPGDVAEVDTHGKGPAHRSGSIGGLQFDGGRGDLVKDLLPVCMCVCVCVCVCTCTCVCVCVHMHMKYDCKIAHVCA